MSERVERWAAVWRRALTIYVNQDAARDFAPVVALVAAVEEWDGMLSNEECADGRNKPVRAALAAVLGEKP